MSATVQPRRIELREYACSPGVVLSRPERDALQRAAPDISIRPVVGTEDCYDLTPGSMIGVIDTGSMVISIQPKIAIERVMFLISYAVDPSCWKELSSEYAGHDSLVEAIAPAFCRLVSRATYRGLLHGYRATEDAMCTVKGRIRFDDQIRDRFGIAPPVEVSYDEFTEDIAENQLLRAAIHRLRRLRLRSSLTVRTLHEIEDAFYGVQLVRYDHRRLAASEYRESCSACCFAISSDHMDLAVLKSVTIRLPSSCVIMSVAPTSWGRSGARRIENVSSIPIMRPAGFEAALAKKLSSILLAVASISWAV